MGASILLLTTVICIIGEHIINKRLIQNAFVFSAAEGLSPFLEHPG
jgi:hypothetical protein